MSKRKISAEKLRAFTYTNTCLTVCDDTSATVENCRKILEYSDVYIKLRTATLFMEFWGSGFIIDDYKPQNIIIRGKISSVEFSALPKRRGKDA